MQKRGTNRQQSSKSSVYKESRQLLNSTMDLAVLLLFRAIKERFKVHRDTANIRFNNMLR